MKLFDLLAHFIGSLHTFSILVLIYLPPSCVPNCLVYPHLHFHLGHCLLQLHSLLMCQSHGLLVTCWILGCIFIADVILTINSTALQYVGVNSKACPLYRIFFIFNVRKWNFTSIKSLVSICQIILCESFCTRNYIFMLLPWGVPSIECGVGCECSVL